jgi:hypothetical protein
MCNSTGGCEDLDLPYDYIAYYKFEDNANDETGKNNGVINGNPTFIKGFNGNAIILVEMICVNIGKLGNFGAPKEEVRCKRVLLSVFGLKQIVLIRWLSLGGVVGLLFYILIIIFMETRMKIPSILTGAVKWRWKPIL